MFLIESMVVGGAEKVLCTLVNHLDPQKYDVTVIAVYKHSVYDGYNHQFENLFAPHVKFKYLCDNSSEFKYQNFNRALHWIPGKVMHAALIGRSYDIEVAFYEGLPTHIIAASSNSKSKKIAWLHIDTNHLAKHLSDKEKRRNVKNYTKYEIIVAVSQAVADSFTNLFGLEKHPLVRYNPIDRNEIISKANESITDVLPSEKFKLVSVGRLVDQKNYDRLLRVYHRLLCEGHDCELWIIGDGEMRDILEEYVTKNGLQQNVRLLGFKNNPYKYMNMCDLFVCSSRAEGFSTVATEATILGLPIVTTDCAGMKELLGDNTYGIITPNNEEALYHGIKRILTDKALYAHYRQKALERSASFSLEKTIDQFTLIF